MSENTANSYKPEEEELLRECADKAQCYRIMHTWDYNDYKIQAMWFTIPVIILSTLTGTANFAQSSFPDEVVEYAPMMIGSINIVAGIVTTISQFLRVNELQEGHRVASLSWGKYSRNLKYELSRHPKDRTPITEMMKISKQEVIINHSAKSLYKIVLDIEKYPEFIPWCSAVRILSKTKKNIVGDLLVKYKFYQKKFTSDVRFNSNNLIIDVFFICKYN